MIILNYEVENLPPLIELLSSIGNVAQVRCNHILRQSIKDKIGGDGINITCLVQKRDGSDYYLKFNDSFPIDYVNDIDNHQKIMQKFKMSIDDYIFKDIVPPGEEG